MTDPPLSPELTAVSASHWAQARRCLPIIQRLANADDRTREDVAAAASELGCSTAQKMERKRPS